MGRLRMTLIVYLSRQNSIQTAFLLCCQIEHSSDRLLVWVLEIGRGRGGQGEQSCVGGVEGGCFEASRWQSPTRCTYVVITVDFKAAPLYLLFFLKKIIIKALYEAAWGGMRGAVKLTRQNVVAARFLRGPSSARAVRRRRLWAFPFGSGRSTLKRRKTRGKCETKCNFTRV